MYVHDWQISTSIMRILPSSFLASRLLHLPFRTADIDEKAIGDRASDPQELVLLIGTAKADALVPQLQSAASREGATLLLTGDQVVVHDGTVLEKPADYAEVRRNIAAYARSPCRTVGSAVITDLVSGRRVSGVDTATIHFTEIPEHIVDELCKVEDILWCAGGLMIEHPLVQPYIASIDGTIDSVMGLSKPLVERLLQQLSDESPNKQ
jgi:septum formation protein